MLHLFRAVAESPDCGPLEGKEGFGVDLIEHQNQHSK